MPKSSRPIFALSPAYIEKLHDEVVALRFPGSEPVGPGECRDRGLLDSASKRPFQTVGGHDLYPRLVEKAAALFHSLVSNHPFTNGNKRTAVLAVDHFFLANGRFLALSNEEMYELATLTATYRERGLSHDQIVGDIIKRLSIYALSLSSLKRRGFRVLYDLSLAASRSIRRDLLNQDQPY